MGAFTYRPVALFLLLGATFCLAYQDGTSLGGWLVMESWLFPNVLLMQAAPPGVGVQQKQEIDYINRMRDHDIDAIASMHTLWNTYVCDDLLSAATPCPRLLQLKAAGVQHIRIPVGWWIAEAPTDVPPEYANSAGNYTNRDKGYTQDGFVSGGIVYLEKLLSLLKQVGLHAYIDMHALPGGAVKQMGYTGKYYDEAHFFDGSVEWAADGNAASLPSSNFTFLRQGVKALWYTAEWVAGLESRSEVSGVITAVAPWNEALLGDDYKAATLQTAFTLKLVPQLRAKLPAGMDIILNWFNTNPDFWSAWVQSHLPVLGANLINDVHIYHAFDMNAYAQGCPQCSRGPVARQNLLCKSCSLDVKDSVVTYTSKGLRVIVGEWSLGSCNMYGQNEAVIDDSDYLYALYGASKSAWRAANATGDYFWSAFVRPDGFDPTAYSDATANSSRVAVQRLLERYQATPSWIGANPYQQTPTDAATSGYLMQWSLATLASTNTSDGHPIALPVAEPADCGAGLEGRDQVSKSMCVQGTCAFTPKPRADFSGAFSDAAHGCNPQIECIMNPGADPKLVKRSLDYVCDTPEANVDCGPIHPSGSHYLPNTLQAHADWAFNQYYQINRDNRDVCYLGGAAYFPQCQSTF